MLNRCFYVYIAIRAGVNIEVLISNLNFGHGQNAFHLPLLNEYAFKKIEVDLQTPSLLQTPPYSLWEWKTIENLNLTFEVVKMYFN